MVVAPNSKLKPAGEKKKRVWFAFVGDIFFALETVKSEIRSARLRRMISALKGEIEAGSNVWRAFNQVNFLPSHVIALIRIGEETGRLAANLRIIANQQEKDRLFRSQISSAMMYPIIVLSLTVVLGLGIAWFILPRLATVFNSLKMDLPLITRLLIALGDFLQNFGLFIMPVVLLGLVVTMYFVFFFPKTKHLGEDFLFSLPKISGLIQEIELGRMGYTLGTLLESGLPVIVALNSLYSSTTFRAYQRFYLHVRNKVEEGNSFQRSFESYPKIGKLFPGPIKQMIVAAEHSGSLPKTLIKIGETFEYKTEVSTKNLSVLLEPIMLIVIWLGVVTVALAVILPIYSLIGGLNNSLNVSTNPTPALTTATATAGEINNGLPLQDAISPATSGSMINLPLIVPAGDQEPIENSNNALPAVLPEDDGLEDSFPKLKIMDTGLGYLKVRSGPSREAAEVSKVKTGDVYPYSDQDNNWYEIRISSDVVGWVFGDYIEELPEATPQTP